MKRTYKQQTFSAGEIMGDLIQFVYDHVDYEEKQFSETDIECLLDAKYIVQITKIETHEQSQDSAKVNP